MQNTGGAISDQQLVRWEEERGREGRTAKCADAVKERSPAGSIRYHPGIMLGSRFPTEAVIPPPGGTPPDHRRPRPAYSGIGHFQRDCGRRHG